MKQLFSKEARWQINSIEYKKNQQDEKAENIRLSVSPLDNIQISERTETEVCFSVCRKITTSPTVYELSIDTLISIKFLCEESSSNLSDNEIIAEFKEQCGNMLSNLMAKISLLVAEITGAEGIPVVTPPVLL